MSDITTICLKPETKAKLDAVKIHPRQSYNEVLLKLLDEYEKRSPK